uniref:Uncharacterized protein n=1 Tax=Tetraselmis sp. GSL018 TaxID=582737 RepID=A0A061R236_9CHLO
MCFRLSSPKQLASSFRASQALRISHGRSTYSVDSQEREKKLSRRLISLRILLFTSPFQTETRSDNKSVLKEPQHQEAPGLRSRHRRNLIFSALIFSILIFEPTCCANESENFQHEPFQDDSSSDSEGDSSSDSSDDEGL